MAFYDDPDMVRDMMARWTDTWLALYGQIAAQAPRGTGADRFIGAGPPLRPERRPG